MSNKNDGEKGDASDSEDKNPREKISSHSDNKSKKKDSIKDSINETDNDNRVITKNTDSVEIPNVEVTIQTVHSLERDQDTKITIPENVSDTTITSAKLIEKLDNTNADNDQISICESMSNNSLVLVTDSNEVMAAKSKETDAGTVGSYSDVFHRKDYQIMLCWRGVGGGVKPGCVLNRLTNILPGRYSPQNCNVYVTYVMFFLFVMLLTTAYCLNYALTRPRTRFYYYQNWWQIMISCLAAIMFLNYLMFSYMMERYVALNYICLILAVVACSMFISAISARVESDALWIANAMTTATVLFLFLLSFANVDFTHRMLCLIAVLFSIFALLCIVYSNRLYSFHDAQYSSKVLYVSGFLGALRVFLLVIELQRLLCSCVASGCCDHAFGAFILYTLYLQFIFFLFQWFPLRRNC